MDLKSKIDSIDENARKVAKTEKDQATEFQKRLVRLRTAVSAAQIVQDNAGVAEEKYKHRKWVGDTQYQRKKFVSNPVALRPVDGHEVYAVITTVSVDKYENLGTSLWRRILDTGPKLVPEGKPVVDACTIEIFRSNGGESASDDLLHSVECHSLLTYQLQEEANGGATVNYVDWDVYGHSSEFRWLNDTNLTAFEEAVAFVAEQAAIPNDSVG